jgi:hypothetical protein
MTRGNGSTAPHNSAMNTGTLIYTYLTMAIGTKHVVRQSFNKSIGILIYIYKSVIY